MAQHIRRVRNIHDTNIVLYSYHMNVDRKNIYMYIFMYIYIYIYITIHLFISVYIYILYIWQNLIKV